MLSVSFRLPRELESSRCEIIGLARTNEEPNLPVYANVGGFGNLAEYYGEI
jgi:hypothetical protein